jgi:hypothetical protein
MSGTQPSWMSQRPWRNCNPGDLRVRHQAPPWPGQVSIDDLPGGPFAIFASRSEGWAAIGLWLLLAHDEWGWTTVSRMIAAFAPPVENNTNAYIDLVCAKLRVTPETSVDVHDRVVREAMMRAIALAEAGARVIWPDAEVTSALTLTEARWPSFLAAYQHGNVLTNTGTTVVTDDTSADDLNAAELQNISGDSTA